MNISICISRSISTSTSMSKSMKIHEIVRGWGAHLCLGRSNNPNAIEFRRFYLTVPRLSVSRHDPTVPLFCSAESIRFPTDFSNDSNLETPNIGESPATKILT
jgi:hypothetical protein